VFFAQEKELAGMTSSGPGHADPIHWKPHQGKINCTREKTEGTTGITGLWVGYTAHQSSQSSERARAGARCGSHDCVASAGTEATSVGGGAAAGWTTEAEAVRASTIMYSQVAIRDKIL
jgi:hypothetical protein